MNFLINVFKGIFIGAGAIAPGVSGGALAIIFGLYEKILYAINNVFKDIKKHGVFLLSIGIGAAIGVIIFASIQLTLVKNYPMPTMYTFAGLVVGTLPSLFMTANKKGFSPKHFIPFVITLAIGITFTYLDNSTISDNVKHTTIDVNIWNVIRLFLIGFVMSGSLVIPGISGTVLLFLLGVYGLVINSVASIKDVLKLPLGSSEMFQAIFEKMYILIPLGIGLLIGALLFSRLMEYLLKNFYSVTYYAILGFVIGSIPELIPGISFEKNGILSMILFLIAINVAYFISKLAKE